MPCQKIKHWSGCPTTPESTNFGHTQIIVSTDSPLFVSGGAFEDVRMVRKDPVAKRSNIAHVTSSDIARRYRISHRFVTHTTPAMAANRTIRPCSQ